MVGLANSNMSTTAIRKQITAGIQVYVQISRLSDGTRKVTQIAESVGVHGGEVDLQELFVFEHLGISAQGKVDGRFRATGIKPTFLPRLQRGEEPVAEGIFNSLVEA